MSVACRVVLGMDAHRDLFRYKRRARGELSPDVRADCEAVIRALSTLVYTIDSECKASGKGGAA